MPEKDYSYILFNVENGVGTITLNRPEQLNALKFKMLMEIDDAITSSMERNDIRVLVIKGNGRSFCAGDDLKGMEEGDEQFQYEDAGDGLIIPQHSVIKHIRDIKKPVIALLHGHCLGAGYEVALACDIRLAADNLKIGDHRTTRAICAISGASWLLPRIVGFGRATEIIMTGRHLGAAEALNIGLVNYIYPFSEFQEKAQEFILKMSELPTACLGNNKAMLNFSQDNELVPSLQNELHLYVENMVTHDHSEGINSFIEKRVPKFQGK